MAYSNDAKYVSLLNKANAAIKERQAAEAGMAFARSKYGGDSKEFAAAKARYDAAKPAAEAADAARLARKKEIDDAAKAEKTKKDTAKKTASAKADVTVLEYQLQQAKDKGDATATATLEAQLKAAQDTAAGKVVTPKKPSDVVDGANPLSKLTVNASGAVTGTSGQVYVTSTVGVNGEATVVIHPSIVEARNEFLKGYSQPGQLEELKKTLLAKHYINNSDITKNDLSWITKGVDTLISKFTYDATMAVQYGGSKEPPTMAGWMSSAQSGITATGAKSQAGTKSVPTTDLTTVGDAYKEINSFMLDAIGREATAEEKDAFFKEINKRELASPVTNTVTKDAAGNTIKATQSGALVQADERNNVAIGIVQKALGATNAETLLNIKNNANPKGSKIAIDISTLQANSAAYGHSLTAGEAYAIVQQGYGQKDYIAKQVERMRLNSMTMYGNLKQHIADGGTVKDIADQYAKLKASKLGIAIPDSLTDKDVMAAITKDGGLMSTAEFTRQMQANPLWRQTEEAHNTAADFANTILKSFGMMG